MLSAAEVALLSSIVQVVPTIGHFIEGLMSGDPAAQKHVADILPERSASQETADELAQRGA